MRLHLQGDSEVSRFVKEILMLSVHYVSFRSEVPPLAVTKNFVGRHRHLHQDILPTTPPSLFGTFNVGYMRWLLKFRVR